MSVVAFTSAPPHKQERGLLGWLSLEIGPLLLDGVALRQTRRGRPTLSFPVRRDRAGRDHAIVRPIDRTARAAIEREVLAALGLAGAEGP